MAEEDRVPYWEAGAAAMRDLGGPYAYACPLCLRLFSRDQIKHHLTLDHVPPESVGGKLKVLTCKACNETAGHQLDWHAFAVERIRRVIAGEPYGVAGEPYEPVRARVTIDGVTAIMELRSDGTLNEIIGLPADNRPGVLDQVTATLGDHVKTGTKPSIQFALPTLRVRLGRAAVSYLRAGYLAAFALMGYAGVMWQSFDRVRQQICEPDVEHLPHFINRSGDLPGYWVGLVEEPKWASSVIVLLGRYSILLPFLGDAGLYERLAEGRGNIRGRCYGWPRRPAYQTDTHWARSGWSLFGDTLPLMASDWRVAWHRGPAQGSSAIEGLP